MPTPPLQIRGSGDPVRLLLVLGPLVFLHELGHYLVGRWCGVKADAFDRLRRGSGGWTDRRGTRWKISMLPLGGYVQFAGDMNPTSSPIAGWRCPLPSASARSRPSPVATRADRAGRAAHQPLVARW
jgi:regulator of sigma E protease